MPGYPLNRCGLMLSPSEMKIPSKLEKVLRMNEMELPNCNINKVMALDGEIKMENIRNRDPE